MTDIQPQPGLSLSRVDAGLAVATARAGRRAGVAEALLQHRFGRTVSE